jgi:DNA-binding GntR family transcriptional regulator
VSANETVDLQPAAAPSFERLSLWERVYEHVRREIVENRLQPGAELNEAALAASLGVSRGPVREAVKHLAAEGLVTMRARRRPVVSELTHDELVEAYQVREALEVLAIKLAVPRLTSGQLGELESLHEAMAVCVEIDSVSGFFAANDRFHALLVAASGNRKLIELHGQLTGQMGRYRLQSLALRGTMKRSIAEHRAIMRAIRKGDADRAAHLLAEHIRVPQRRVAATAPAAT